MPELTILATTRARETDLGEINLSRKFLDGVIELQRHWSGRVVVVMEPAQWELPLLDRAVVQRRDLPFELEIARQDAGAEVLRDTDLVLAMLATRYLSLQHTNRVWWTEWSLRTRKQIAWLSSTNPVVRLRRILGAQLRERRLHRGASLAVGVQCNGTPAYSQYRRANPNSILYFDTRLRERMLATPDDIRSRISNASSLRLAYSGRLVTIKGADQLIDVAIELRRFGVPFEFTLFGDGDLAPRIKSRIAGARLERQMTLAGVVDFTTELVPFVKSSVDVFVCCHRQGDPSSTYLETLGCGVPIAGYANEALAGIVDRSRAGWLVPMDRPDLLARRLAELFANRAAVHQASTRGLEFARQHTFEETFKTRANHLMSALPSGRRYRTSTEPSR